MRGIVATSAFLLFLQGVHGLDHLLLQDRGLPVQIGALGVVESGATMLVLFLAWSDSPQAPVAAVVAGTGIALAFVVAHILPSWGFLSDPYADASLGTHSWAIMFAGLAGALALAVAGALALQGSTTRKGAPWPSTEK
ncbi:MAG: hypothetical protein WD649_00705 [Thermoleophilaceae bacterium]